MDRGDQAEALAEGFAYEQTLCAEVEGQEIEWQEQRLVVRSFKHTQRQQKALDARLEKARAEIAELNVRGRGHKVVVGNELSSVIDKILAKHRVEGIVTPSYHTETRTIRKRAYKDHPGRTILEPLGQLTDVYLKIIQELYRIGKPGATIHIEVPHHRHDNFFHDPTHVRPITVYGLSMFSKKRNQEWIEPGNPTTPLGLYLDVDFELIETVLTPSPVWLERYADRASDTELLLKESELFRHALIRVPHWRPNDDVPFHLTQPLCG